MKITRRQLRKVIEEAHGLSKDDVNYVKKVAEETEDEELKRILKFIAKSNVEVDVTQDVTKMKKEAKMKITHKQLRQIIKEELSKAAPFGSGMNQAKLNKDQKDLVGHTWLTHVKRKGSAIKEVGEVLWHSLNESGDIKVYDVYWTRSDKIERDISADLLEAVKLKEHSHDVSEEDAPVSDRKKK